MLAPQDLPSEVALEDVGCPLGCARGDERVLSGGDRVSGVGGTFQIVRCKTCGLARTNPRPTRETIGCYYPDSYSPYHDTKAVVRPPRPRSLARRIGRRVIQFNSDRLPPMLPGHALEIGCASGAYLSYLAGQGWTVEGVELNVAAAKAARARGFRVQTCAVERMAPPERPVTATVAWMVLEHLHDPVGALRQFNEWSTPDAWLVASVPNVSAAGLRIFGSEWYPLQLPCHLYHYDAKSLASVLAAGGWRLERVLYHRTLNDYLASLGNWVESRGRPLPATSLRQLAKKRMFHLASYPVASAAASLGQTGRMTVWARRV